MICFSDWVFLEFLAFLRLRARLFSPTKQIVIFSVSFRIAQEKVNVFVTNPEINKFVDASACKNLFNFFKILFLTLNVL